MQTQERPRPESPAPARAATGVAPRAAEPAVSPPRAEPGVNGAAAGVNGVPLAERPVGATAAPPTPTHGTAGPAPAMSHAATAAGPVKSRRSGSLRKWLLIPLVLLAAAVASGLGYRYWYEDAHYVTTENAQITGALVQFGSLQSGRVTAVNVDVGARVRADQEVAVVTLPATVSTATDGSSRLSYTGTDDQRIPVKAPVDGVVAARLSNPGDTVQSGQVMLSVIDPRRLWVQANIEETRVARLEVGQYVEVKVDSLNRTVGGRVVAITPATASAFSLLPQQNASGNFNKVTQLVPVKIAFEDPNLPLVLGASVEVKIHIADGE